MAEKTDEAPEAQVRRAWVQVDFDYGEHFRRKGQGPDCERCHKAFCCRQLALSTEEEAVLIREVVRQWPQKKQRQLSERLAALPNHARSNYDGECPFLVNERCQVYEVRPMACRMFHSLNKSKCKRRTKALDEELYSALLANNKRLREGLESSGGRAKVVVMPIWMKYHWQDR